MLLDLRKLKRTGKDSQDFYFEYAPKTDLAEDLPQCEINLPIKITGTVSLTGEHSAYVEGEISFTITGECTRCLNQATNQYSAQFGEEITEDEIDGYQLVNDTVNLTKIVDDAVLMNIPVTFLCKEDCKGLCFKCGKNLNEAECECNKQ